MGHMGLRSVILLRRVFGPNMNASLIDPTKLMAALSEAMDCAVRSFDSALQWLTMPDHREASLQKKCI